MSDGVPRSPLVLAANTVPQCGWTSRRPSASRIPAAPRCARVPSTQKVWARVQERGERQAGPRQAARRFDGLNAAHDALERLSEEVQETLEPKEDERDEELRKDLRVLGEDFGSRLHSLRVDGATPEEQERLAEKYGR